MNKRERDVLHSLCDGDITFSEAAKHLGITEEKIEELLEDYSWLPSPERLAELNETELETLSYIREFCQPIRPQPSYAHTEVQFNTTNQNVLNPMHFTPISIGNVTMNYIDNVPGEVEPNVGVISYFSFETFMPESSGDTEECLVSSSQSANAYFQLKNTQAVKKALII